MASLLYRAIQLGRVREGSERYLWMQMSAYKRREPPELDFPKEEATLWRDIFNLYFDEFGYSNAQFAELLAFDENNLKEFYQVAPSGGRLRIMRLVK